MVREFLAPLQGVDCVSPLSPLRVKRLSQAAGFSEACFRGEMAVLRQSREGGGQIHSQPTAVLVRLVTQASCLRLCCVWTQLLGLPAPYC